MKRPLDVLLAAGAFICLALLFFANEDPFLRDVVCAGFDICLRAGHAGAFNKIIYDLAAGALVSIIFYFLIVRIPESQKRHRYKKLLVIQYRNFRIDCIGTILAVADGSYEASLPQVLLDKKKFRAYFKEKVTSDQDRWDRFCNNLDSHYQREIVTQLQILRDEIAFILNNVDIPSDEPIRFLRNLSAAIYTLRDATLEYDDVKKFSRFLWSVLAGFDFINGYRERDIIQDMIEAV